MREALVLQHLLEKFTGYVTLLTSLENQRCLFRLAPCTNHVKQALKLSFTTLKTTSQPATPATPTPALHCQVCFILWHPNPLKLR
jgi:hypothetical protein